jgi:hypothetical protein
MAELSDLSPYLCFKQSLMYAHHLEGIYRMHRDGKIDLRKDSDAREAVQQLTQRVDSDAGNMLRQALTFYDPTPIITEHQEYHYANSKGIVPRMRDGAMPGAKEIVRQLKTRNGKWANTGEVSRNLGRIDVGYGEVVYGVKYKTASIEYTSQELDSISFARSNNQFGLMIDTVADKRAAVDEAYQEAINEVMAFGIPGMSIYGLHNQPLITRVKAPFRPGATHTAQENIALFTFAIGLVYAITGSRHSINTVILDKDVDTELSMQVVGVNADKTTKQFIVENSSIKSFVTTPEAAVASRDRKPVMHFYLRDTDTEGIIPKAMTQIAMPTYTNGVWSINWDAAFSGVHSKRPYKHLILELPE